MIFVIRALYAFTSSRSYSSSCSCLRRLLLCLCCWPPAIRHCYPHRNPHPPQQQQMRSSLVPALPPPPMPPPLQSPVAAVSAATAAASPRVSRKLLNWFISSLLLSGPCAIHFIQLNFSCSPLQLPDLRGPLGRGGTQ